MGNSTLLEEYLQREFVRRSDISSQFLEMSLLLAVIAGIVPSVVMLLDYGAPLNENSILIASLKEDIIVLDILLKRRGSNYTADYSKIKHGNSPLIAAAARGLVSSVNCLIEHDVDVNNCNNENISALSKAVIHGEYEVCQILLENGAFVNVREGIYKRTPLHIVADLDRRKRKRNLVDITRLLIQHGASVFMKDYRGHYPIHCAAIRNHNEIVEALLEVDISQASVKIKSQGKTSAIKGMDLFHIAVWKNNPKLIDILLRHNIYPNMQDLYGRTPFYRSVYDRKQKIAEKLFGVADIQQSEKTGYTSLHAAVRSGNMTLVKMICPHVDINAKDKFGKTPIHTACETMNLEIFCILGKDYRADVRMRTNKGQTIFDILQSKKAQSQKIKTLKKDESPPSFKKLFDQFQQIVGSVDYDFAYNFERLPFSWRVISSSD
ncbi:ankyrin-3-like [Mercenaria mercenaria]|uniref:ankyrin-3-like n=1 Tax=Mercenaria mercenaria TaxID=6596 RepID=UPI00234F47C5|nr:ankyrin-3-like [Mercenaria mercenaria]